MSVLPAASALGPSVLILLGWTCLSPGSTGAIDPKSKDTVRGSELPGTLLGKGLT